MERYSDRLSANTSGRDTLLLPSLGAGLSTLPTIRGVFLSMSREEEKEEEEEEEAEGRW